MRNKPLILSWFVTYLLLFLYSFTQIDLGLTLTRFSYWQVIQRFFQHIGYFERPFSASLYLSLLFVLFFLYVWTLILAYREKLAGKDIWIIVLFAGAILLFSYNAFSYDLFNYMFDAKIVTFYHQNPYFQKALDYPADPMLGFMHWTHRTYPYGPVWLFLTVPLSFLGFNYLLPTFYLFKLLAVLSLIGAIFFLEKSLNILKIKKNLFCLVFFALNPLVLIESLVSGHNDIVMVFFAIFSFYLLLKRKYLSSFFWLVVSVGVKFATAVLLPFYLILVFFKNRTAQFYKTFLFLITLFMITATLAATLRTNFQPWYLLYFLPFSAFLAESYFVFIPIVIISLFSLLTYTPFLYSGNWDPPIPLIINSLLFISIALSFIIIFIIYVTIKLKVKNQND